MFEQLCEGESRGRETRETQQTQREEGSVQTSTGGVPPVYKVNKGERVWSQDLGMS